MAFGNLEDVEEVQDIVEMYEDFREQYPELTKIADAIHVAVWDRVDEAIYCWFESLAEALNRQMGLADRNIDFTSAFSFFDGKYRKGSKDVRDCIDVSFVENLFWRVRQEDAAPVWDLLPEHLQELYLGFHGRPPPNGLA